MQGVEKRQFPFGRRLFEERKRLGFDQVFCASTGGVTVQSQRNYESGRRAPDAEYISALAAIGVDVLYVLTGERRESGAGNRLISDGAASYRAGSDAGGMAPEERALLACWRALSARQRLAVGAVMRELCTDTPDPLTPLTTAPPNREPI